MQNNHSNLVGTELAGFALTRCVAKSPFAMVFEGYAGEIRAAVKVYAKGSSASARRDEREARTQAQVAHPCVARALGALRRPDGSFVLASEWIDGVSLEAHLTGEHGVQGPLALHEILAITRDIARGLGAIHATKTVHRDLKPSNIMLPASGNPKAVIVDFGHALVIDDSRITDTGYVLGSAHYMAPEQAQGLELDTRADLYALGVIMYRMLTGKLPFEHASAAEVMRMHRDEPVTPPRAHANVLPAAEDLCIWLLAKEPAKRLPNAHVLRLTLESIERSAPKPEMTA